MCSHLPPTVQEQDGAANEPPAKTVRASFMQSVRDAIDGEFAVTVSISVQVCLHASTPACAPRPLSKP